MLLTSVARFRCNVCTYMPIGSVQIWSPHVVWQSTRPLDHKHGDHTVTWPCATCILLLCNYHRKDTTNACFRGQSKQLRSADYGTWRVKRFMTFTDVQELLLSGCRTIQYPNRTSDVIHCQVTHHYSDLITMTALIIDKRIGQTTSM